MPAFDRRDRDLPEPAALRRIDRAAGEINRFLAVLAIGLAIVDGLCLARRSLEALPPLIVELSAPAP